MNTLRLPSFWSRLDWTAKAAYLRSSRQARDYSEACSLLAKMRRPKVKLPPHRQQKLWYREE